MSKVTSRTVGLESYFFIKEKIKEVESGKFYNIGLDELLKKFTKRRVGKRPVRLSTPLEKTLYDDVPSPKRKVYESSMTRKLP